MIEQCKMDLQESLAKLKLMFLLTDKALSYLSLCYCEVPYILHEEGPHFHFLTFFLNSSKIGSFVGNNSGPLQEIVAVSNSSVFSCGGKFLKLPKIINFFPWEENIHDHQLQEN